MPFASLTMNEREIQALPSQSKAYKISIGNSLYVQVRPNGGKYFYWRYRFPAGKGSNKKTFYIGAFGRESGRLTLQEAKKKRETLDHLRRQGIDPAPLGSENESEVSGGIGKDNFEKVAKDFYENSKARLADSTLKDLSNRLNNQIIPVFNERSIGSITRQECIAFKKSIEARGKVVQAKKNFEVLEQVFSFAMDVEYMEEKLNPARKSVHLKVNHKVRHSPRLELVELPEFLEEITDNRMNRDWVVVHCIKVLLLTFMRVGAIAPARWEEVDMDNRIWTIPLERVKKSGLIADHLIPMSDILIEVLEELRRLNPSSDYIFASQRGTWRGSGPYSNRNKTPHINRSSPTRLLKGMGYGGRLVAHGCRAMALSIGQDELKFPYHVIDMQMAHKPPGKTRQAYDHADFMDERTDFMNQWGDLLVKLGLGA